MNKPKKQLVPWLIKGIQELVEKARKIENGE
jgi:hypothetical protein